MVRGGSAVDRERLPQITARQRQKRLGKSAQNRLLHAQDEIDRLSLLLSLPEEVKEDSLEIYCEASASDLIHGRSIERILAAAIYMACRKYKVPRTLDEIEDVTKVRRTDIIKICKILAKKLGMKLAVSSPLEYIGVFCAKLNLKKPVEERARKIIYAALERDITSGKSPTSIAAAAIYMTVKLCDEKKTQKDVADATGVTGVTLRARYRELVRELGAKIE